MSNGELRGTPETRSRLGGVLMIGTRNLAELQRLWVGGASAIELGKRFGCAPSTIHKIARAQHFPPRVHTKRFGGPGQTSPPVSADGRLPCDPTPEEIAAQCRALREAMPDIPYPPVEYEPRIIRTKLGVVL